MAATQNSYTGNGSTTNYSFTFPYLKTADVKCSLDATETTAFTLANATTIQFNSAPANGAKIKIFRVTDDSDLTATFYAGSAIKSSDLNDNFTQNLYTTQEVNARYLSNLGGTMLGDLAMGEDADIIFEGATDNANETKLTVADPTADRTITFPDVSGNVVTTGDTGTVATGMIAADAITSAKIADDQINSEHYVDGSIDTAHIADSQVTTAKIANSNVTTDKIANDAVTSAKIADDQINSEHYVDGSIDTAHIADSQITSAKIVDGTIVAGDLASNSVTTAKITDANVTEAKIAADAITGAKIADDEINSEHYVAGSIDTEHIADSQITTAKIADNAINSAKIADDAVGSTELADGVIDTVHIGSVQVTDAKLASNSVTTAKITDANVTTDKIANDAITIGKLGCEQTTISDSDSHIPTSGAVVDYVAAQIAPLGGLEVIATEVAFPNTQPSAGVVISISDAGGVVVNGSGVSTTGRTVGSSTVTINGFPSSLQSSTLAAGIGLMVSSTGSSQTYNYHKILGKEDDIKQLSDDINDFAARYRVGSSNPTSSLDAGDLFFNTSTQKLLVYNATNSAWEEAQSVGNFFISTFSEAFDGSRTQFTLSNAPTNVQQVILSLNGVIQKPGTAFTLSGSTVTLASAPASGTEYFAVVMGSTVNIGQPSNNTVTTAILQDDSVTSAKIAASNVTSTELGANAVITSKIADSNVTTAKIADDAVTGDKIANNLDIPDNNKIRFGNSQDLQLYHDGVNRIVGSGNLLFQSPDIFFKSLDGNTTFATINSSGATLTGNLLPEADNTRNLGSDTLGWNSIWASTRFRGNDNVKLILGDAQDLQIYHDTSSSRIIAASHDLIVQSNGYAIRSENGSSTFATIDSSGKVGIGTSSPIDILSANYTVTGSNGLRLQDNTNNTVTTLATTHTSYNYAGVSGHNSLLYAARDLAIVADGANSGSIKFAAGNAERMRIDSSGQLLLNEQAAGGTCRLGMSFGNAVGNYMELGGTQRAANGLSKVFVFRHGYWGGSKEVASIGVNTTSSTGGSGRGLGDLVFHTGTSGNGDSATTSVQRMKINSSGEVLIGTNDALNLGANNVTGVTIFPDGRVTAARNSSSSAHFGRQQSNGEVVLFGCQGTAIVGTISVTTSSTAFNTSYSDRTLKKNFENWTENTLELFKNINPQKFNFTHQEDTDTKHKGYVAQDLVSSFPEAYNKGDDDKYMFNPSGMVVYLMKAIQESETKVAALEAK